MAVNHLVTGSNPVGGANFRRDARVVEWNGLENRRGASHPGFESLSLRHCSLQIMCDWKGGRVVECAPLLRVCTEFRYRGFESLSFRQFPQVGPVAQWLEQRS